MNIDDWCWRWLIRKNLTVGYNLIIGTISNYQLNQIKKELGKGMLQKARCLGLEVTQVD